MFNGSGVWIPPSGQPVVSGTVIQSTTHNALVGDIGASFNNTVTRDGQGVMTGPFKLQSGTVTIPGLSFNSEPSTGLWWPSTGVLSTTVAGVEVLRMKSNGAVLIKTTTDNGTSALQVNGDVLATSFTGTHIGAVTGHASLDLALTGGTMSGDLVLSTVGARVLQQTVTSAGTDLKNSRWQHSVDGSLTFGAFNDAQTAFTRSMTIAPTGGFSFTGAVTAPSFQGPLTGNVTGSVTGSVIGHASLDLALTGGALSGPLTISAVSAIPFSIDTTAAGGYVPFSGSGVPYGYVGSGLGVFAGGLGTDFGVRGQSRILFGIGSAEMMRLDSAGNLGISGAAVGARVHSISGVTATPAFRAQTGGVNQGSIQLGNNVILFGGSDYSGFKLSYGASDRLVVGATVVSVGMTTEAVNSLSINTQGAGYASVAANASGFSAIEMCVNNQGTPTGYGIPSGSHGIAGFSNVPFHIANGGTPRLTITTLGLLTESFSGNELGYKSVPLVVYTGASTLAIGDRGKSHYKTDATQVTIPAGVFAAGDMITILNWSFTNMTIVQGAGLTLYKGGSNVTGNRTILGVGTATILFQSASAGVLQGTIT